MFQWVVVKLCCLVPPAFGPLSDTGAEHLYVIEAEGNIKVKVKEQAKMPWKFDTASKHH
jgi:hypothetical protein